MSVLRQPVDHKRTPSRRSYTINDVIFALFVVALAWTPFWFGSNRPLAWGLNAVFFCGLAAALEVSLALTGKPRPVALRWVWPAAFAIGLTAAWIALQASTWTPVQFHNHVWDMASEALEVDVPGSISVNRDATWLALLRLITAASAFWLALQLCRAPNRARMLTAALAIIGCLYAIYGIVAFIAFPRTILWYEKLYYLDSLTATFVNRNTYATYAGLGLISATALAISVFTRETKGGRRPLAAFFAAIAGRGGFWLAIAIVIAIAFVLTGSRGGISFMTVGVLAVIILSLSHVNEARITKISVAVLSLAILAIALTSIGDLLAARIQTEGFASESRLATYQITLKSIADQPWLGFGYGTFEYVFPMYRDSSLSMLGKWDKAHNTYLELFQGLGIPIAAALMIGVVTLLRRVLIGALTRRRNLTPSLVASATSLGILLHALVDFSLQCQAVTLTWMALLGAGVAQSWSSKLDTATG